MGPFWRMKRELPECGKPSEPFFAWASEKQFISMLGDPFDRIQHLLVEIQKRCLAEQVLLLVSHTGENRVRRMNMIPRNEKAVLSEDLQKMLLKKCANGNPLLRYEDLLQDGDIRPYLQGSQVNNLICALLLASDDTTEALVIVNHSDLGDSSRVMDLVSFASPVLALSTQNARLYRELKRKRAELDRWVKHVEERIEEGTKKFLEREFQYHVLFEGTNDGIVIHAKDGHIIEANQMACRQLGYQRKEMLSLSWGMLSHPDSYPEQMTFFESILRKEKVRPLSTRIKRKDGTVFTVEISSRRVWFHGKEVIQTLIRDMTIRKAMEQTLHDSKEKYRILVESSLVGVFIIRKGIIQFANGPFMQFVGRSKEELLEHDLFELIATEDRSMVTSRELRREDGESVPEQYESRFMKKEDGKCWGEIRARRIILEGKPAVLGNVIDITQRKLFELQFFESQKMESIGTLAGGIAHDFNNLLGGILGYASLLLSDMPKSHPHYDDIYTIAETAKRAADLTNRLLAFARGGKYHVISVDMNKVVQDVLGILTNSIDRSVAVETSLTKKLWTVKGDAQQLHQVLFNVCLNAVDAIQGGGTITITTDNVILDEQFSKTQLDVIPGDYIRTVVSDTGMGMDEKTKSRIFEPFFTTKPTGEGTGLGLAMAYGIVKNHQGLILVDSQLGKGTKVSIYLPRHTEESLEAQPIRVVKPASKKGILLVDDEEVIRQVGKRMLEKGGYNVHLARDGVEAIDYFRNNRDRIDLVILDMVMPNMGGKEAYRKLRELDQELPIVLTSGYSAYHDPALKNLRDVPFLQKPFQTERLLSTVQEVFQV